METLNIFVVKRNTLKKNYSDSFVIALFAPFEIHDIGQLDFIHGSYLLWRREGSLWFYAAFYTAVSKL